MWEGLCLNLLCTYLQLKLQPWSFITHRIGRLTDLESRAQANIILYDEKFPGLELMGLGVWVITSLGALSLSCMGHVMLLSPYLGGNVPISALSRSCDPALKVGCRAVHREPVGQLQLSVLGATHFVY